MKRKRMMITGSEGTILTNDPSMTAWGWVVLDKKGNVIDCGCVKTEPEHKKRRIRVSDDRVWRINELSQSIVEVIKKYNVDFILGEAPHGSQNAQAATMIGMVIAILQTLSFTLNIPIEWYSEQDAKKALLGKKSATKQQIKSAISKLYDVKWSGIKYKDEAIADALAVYNVARKQSTVLKIISKT